MPTTSPGRWSKRGRFLFAALVVGVLLVMSVLTPWWTYPGTDRWRLSAGLPGPSSCVFAGDTIRLSAIRSAGDALSYHSGDWGARTIGRFKWSIVAPDDSFWVEKRYQPIMSWRGAGTIDRNGLFTGTQEGLVAVQVREGNGRAFQLLTVLPPIEITLAPSNPSVPTGGYIDLEIRARFPDGTVPPWTDRPRLRHADTSGVSVIREPSTRGRPYAPWYAVVRVTREGPQPATLTYHTRRMDLTFNGVGASVIRVDTAFERRVRYADYPVPASYDTTLVPPTRWRMIRMGQCG